MNVVWCDDFVRLDPLTGGVLDGDGQHPRRPSAAMSCARNEFASFQLLVGPISRSQTVRVIPGILKGPGRSMLPPEQLDVYVEWYTRCDNKWYPEVLVPQQVTGGSTPDFRKKNDVRGQRFAGFWVDIFVPGDANPGVYAGAVTIRADGHSIPFPVELAVRRGRLSTDCCLDVSLNNYVDNISRGWPGLYEKPGHLSSTRYLRIEQGVFRTAHDHRMFFHYLPYGHSGYAPAEFLVPLEGEGPHKRVTDWSAWDKHFGPYFDGSAFRGTRRGTVPVKRFYLPLNLCWPADFVKFGRPGYEAEWRAVGRQMVEHFRKKGWIHTHFDMFLNHKQRYRFFPWDTEEMRFLEDLDLHRYFRRLWEGTFDRRSTLPVMFDYTLGTTWTYHLDIRSDLQEFIDVYIAGTSGPAWFPQDTLRLRKKGRQIWSCTNSGAIPDSTRAAAFVPLLMWMRYLTGYMPRWCTTGGWGADPWRQPADKGGTTFLYPGAEFDSEGTFASLRLKVQRNALQMVDEFELAARRGGIGVAKVRRQINKVLGVEDRAWFAPPPAYVMKKPPKEWVGADYATEEPPLAGWNKFSTEQYRALRRLALDLVSE
ncbi:MAG: hypothetical protein N2255_04040 [Kiritimatiellae bacterium]|nr:hypothetical protein [Kiritimatiellia bacterium]